jgi:signal transduction histidine kinase
MASPLSQDGGENHQEKRKPDADRHISLTLAHELNNLLTVVQGHAERLFAKHREDSVLASNLKTISDAAHRAAELVRNAPKPDFSPPAS